MHTAPLPHTLPQPPQLFGSFCSVVQVPPQLSSPMLQHFGAVGAIVLVSHCWPTAHAVPQAPQLLGSVLVLVHAPLHSVSPAGHWQAPGGVLPVETHDWPVEHMLLHVPQLLKSLDRSAHVVGLTVGQAVVPGGQDELHFAPLLWTVPLVGSQNCSDGQAWPQPRQLAASVFKLTQDVPQPVRPLPQQMPLVACRPDPQQMPLSKCWPDGQQWPRPSAPVLHVLLVPEHTVPQAPQLLLSVSGFEHVPLHSSLPAAQQWPLRQLLLAQVAPHEPQFALSLPRTFVHVPLQLFGVADAQHFAGVPPPLT